MKKIIIGVFGGTVVLIGLALIILPGPAFIVIPAGLAILATEFVWARRTLKKAREMIGKAAPKSGFFARFFGKKEGHAPSAEGERPVSPNTGLEVDQP